MTIIAKNVWKWIRIAFGILFLAFALLVLGFIYVMEICTTTISTYENPENHYTIVFQAVGEPNFPFGSTTVKVTLRNQTGKKVKALTVDIHDDGRLAGEGNISVNWLEDAVEVTLHGSEQKDEVYHMDY